jgi:hypothetical protein
MRTNPDKNVYLKSLEQNIYKAHHQLIQEGNQVSIELLLNKLNGKKESFRSLVEIFTEHNNQIRALINREYTPGTLERHQTSLKHTIDFLRWKFQVSDMDIKKIDHEFITSYEFYLRSVRKCNNNSAVKYIKNHACPTKVGFKLAVILFCQWLQPKICCFKFGGSTPSLFQGENTRGDPFIFLQAL